MTLLDVTQQAVGHLPTLAPKTGQKWDGLPLLLQNPYHPAAAQGESDIGGIARHVSVPFVDGLVPSFQGEPDSPERNFRFHVALPKEKARFRGLAGRKC